MDILKSFIQDGKEILINIQGTYDEPLFQANQIGKLLGLTNIRKTIAKFDEDEKITMTDFTQGGIQRITFLTVVGLYRLLSMSRKPVAHMFRKWACKIVKDIQLTDTYELQKQIEFERKQTESRIDNETHQLLISLNTDKSVIYLAKLRKFDDIKNIIKLGWTDNIKETENKLTKQFGSFSFKSVFEVYQNKKFVSFLKKQNIICNHIFTDFIVDNVKSAETYLFTENEYENVIKIIETNIENYHIYFENQFIKKQIVDTLKKLELENKKLEQINNLIDNVSPDRILYLLKNITSHHSVDQTCYAGIDDNVPRENTRQRRVQQYNPETLELIKTFDGIMDVIRTYPQMSKFGVKNASLKNTIYHGYRWFLIEPDAERIQYDIPPTNEIHHTSIPKLIAMLNKDKTRIENVFQSQQQAASLTGINRKQTINDSVKHGRLVKNNYYFMVFDECSEDLKTEYLSRAQLPNTNMSKGTAVEQLNINTHQVIKKFESISEVLKEFCMSRASLKRACETNEAHKGFLWRYVNNVG